MTLSREVGASDGRQLAATELNLGKEIIFGVSRYLHGAAKIYSIEFRFVVILAIGIVIFSVVIH